jgi:chromosome segregation ATPase
LLATSNVTFQPAEIAKAIGDNWTEAANLEGIEKIRKSIYEQRTGVNTRRKEAEAGAHGIKAAMPEDMDKDWVAELTAVESELLDRSNELSRIEAEARQQWDEYRAGVVAEYDAMIEKLKAERDAKIQATRETFDSDKTAAVTELSAEVASLTGRKSEAKAKADEQKRSATLKQQFDQSIKRYQELDRESDKLTKAIEKLDELKAAKLAEDGIEGMEIVDGDIVVDGVPFDALNTARRYELAFSIAARGAGSLPLMICDQAEVFDSAAWAEFCEVARQSGLQIIAARVEDGPLDVEVAA